MNIQTVFDEISSDFQAKLVKNGENTEGGKTKQDFDRKKAKLDFDRKCTIKC